MISFGKRALNALRASLVRMPPATDNVEHNRALWNRYAIKWNKDRIGVQQSETGNEAEFRSTISHLGDEWGSPSHVERLLDDFLFPYIPDNAAGLEIGVGGGRIANKTAPRLKTLTCCDISSGMLTHAKANLAKYDNITFHLLDRPGLPVPEGSLDLIYSFDVFVHLDLHTIWKYFEEITRALRPGGHVFLHVSNLRAPGGWEEFTSQEAYSVVGHYFILPDTIALFCEKAGLELVKTSSPDPDNFYLNRDYLFVARKPGA